MTITIKAIGRINGKEQYHATIDGQKGFGTGYSPNEAIGDLISQTTPIHIDQHTKQVIHAQLEQSINDALKKQASALKYLVAFNLNKE
jgi:hypothetical protein